MPGDFQQVSQIAGDLEFDRRVHLLDNGVNFGVWSVTGTGADFGFTAQVGSRYHGTYGHKLVTRATDPAVDDYVKANRALSYPESKRLVTRLRLNILDKALYKSATIYLDVYNGTTNYRAALQYDPVTPYWRFLASNNAFQAIVGADWVQTNYQWIQAEFQIDLNAMKYLSCCVGGLRVNLAENAMRTVGASTRRGLDFYLYLIAAGATQAEIWTDHIYVGEHVEL